MKKQLYAVYDTCAGIYDSPHFANSDDIVKRQFQDIATAADNPIAKHPEHYSLWRLANWDNITGIINDEKNECLMQAVEAIALAQNVIPIRPDDTVENDLPLYRPGLTD